MENKEFEQRCKLSEEESEKITGGVDPKPIYKKVKCGFPGCGLVVEVNVHVSSPIFICPAGHESYMNTDL